MMSLSDYQRKILGVTIEHDKNSNDGPILTGEKNLDISKEDLMEKVKENVHGKDYLDVMETESNILVRQGLFKGRIDPKLGAIMFEIPDWDMFITAVHAFYKVCWCEDEREDGE
jgi:hypothetical protein